MDVLCPTCKHDIDDHEPGIGCSECECENQPSDVARLLQFHPDEWQPLKPASFRELSPEQIAAFGDIAYSILDQDEVWLNDLYQVNKRRMESNEPGWPDIIQLSIKRLDKEAVHDWRHFQWIKNQLVGPEREAVELYPSESRLVDTANQYYLFSVDMDGFRWPFGFTYRLVSGLDGVGSKQRHFPSNMTPGDMVDLSTAEKVREYIRKHSTGI